MRITTIAFLFVLITLPATRIRAQQSATRQQTTAQQYFTIESYYKVKWGYADEFIKLWKTNHYPLLKKAQEHGDVISIKAETPRFHSGEETRWDFRVTVTFKNVEKAFDEDLVVPYKKQLFPDSTPPVKPKSTPFKPS